MNFTIKDLENINCVIEHCAKQTDKKLVECIPTLLKVKYHFFPESGSDYENGGFDDEDAIDEIISELQKEVEVIQAEENEKNRTVKIIPEYPNRKNEIEFLVIGVGSTGENYIDHIVKAGCWSQYVKTMAIDCDQERLEACSVDYKILLGKKELSHSSYGGNHEKGVAGMHEARLEIENCLKDAGMKRAIIIINCGGGCAGGIDELLAVLDSNGMSYTIGAFTPFAFESEKRLKSSKELKERLEKCGKNVFFFSNVELLKLCDRRTTMAHCLAIGNREMTKMIVPERAYFDYLFSSIRNGI